MGVIISNDKYRVTIGKCDAYDDIPAYIVTFKVQVKVWFFWITIKEFRELEYDDDFEFTKECVGYSIVYCKYLKESHYSIREIDNSFHTYYGNPVFKNEADAQYVIDNPNFRNILDKMFKG